MDIYDYSMVKKIRFKAIKEGDEEVEDACFILLGKIHKSIHPKNIDAFENSSGLNFKDKLMESKEIREELLQYLGDYGEQLYDSWSGKCVGWGYKIIKDCGEGVWSELKAYGDLECSYPSWFLITRSLTIEQAIDKYGSITRIVLGPRGGFKGIFFGEHRFCSKHLDPRDTIHLNQSLVEVEK